MSRVVDNKDMRPIPYPVEKEIDNIGRIVIPKEMRDSHNIKPYDILEVYLTRTGIYIEKQRDILKSKNLFDD